MKKFGGSWTEEKLTAFEKYVKAYLTILNKVKRKYGWKTIYFDGFAGFGERKEVIPKQNSLFNFIIDANRKNDYSVYKGSVERILSLPEPYKFDWYYFIETNSKYIEELNKLVENKYKSLKPKIAIRDDDCNNQLSLLAALLKRDKRFTALVLLDPFGLQVKWESIKKLEDTKSDVWILLPSGVAINRMLPKNGLIKYQTILEDFFGKPIDELKKIFYFESGQKTIFDDRKSVVKISNAIDKIVEIYIKQLEEVWTYVTKKPMILKNSKNVPIFHFLFATNDPVGLKIASDIIRTI